MTSSFESERTSVSGVFELLPKQGQAKMSKVEVLRSLVEQRLAAAVEEIFGLFERTIAEYEEELGRCREETRLRTTGSVDEPSDKSLHALAWS